MVSSACLEMKPTWLSCFWVLQNSALKVCFFCPDVHWRFDSLALSMIFHLKKWMHQIQYIKIWFGVLQWHPAHCFLLGQHLPASKSTEKVVHVSPLRILFVGLLDAFHQKMLRFQLEIKKRRWHTMREPYFKVKNHLQPPARLVAIIVTMTAVALRSVFKPYQSNLSRTVLGDWFQLLYFCSGSEIPMGCVCRRITMCSFDMYLNYFKFIYIYIYNFLLVLNEQFWDWNDKIDLKMLKDWNVIACIV